LRPAEPVGLLPFGGLFRSCRTGFVLNEIRGPVEAVSGLMKAGLFQTIMTEFAGEITTDEESHGERACH
jgi:hypothetical protein